MLRTTALLLTTLLAAGTAIAQILEPDQIKARIFVTPTGSELEVKLDEGEVLKGTLLRTGDEKFELRIEGDAARELLGTSSYQRWIDYSDVVELNGAKPHHTTSSRELLQSLHLGHKVSVRTLSGNVYEGKIKGLDEEHIRVDDKTILFSEEDLMRIDVTRNDSILNGALIGLGVGAGLIALTGCPDCTNEEATSFFLLVGGTSVGLGVLFDIMRKTHTTVYVAADRDNKLTVAPLVMRGRKGVVVSFSF
ncbi:MAG TPA: hypothetical protein VEK15_29675 [Vicinamibacteria bacterium]|nr:hypothetical protein [Vicinamibacteria bacterium]